MKNIETIYLHIAFGRNWWEDTYRNLLLFIAKDKENQLVTLEEIYNLLSSATGLKDIQRENLLYILDINPDYFEKKTETTYLIKQVSEGIKENFKNNSTLSLLELNKEKESIDNRVKKISSKPSYAKGFLLLILYPILSKITLEFFKNEFPSLETNNNKFNLTPYFKRFYSLYPAAKIELAVDALLNVNLYSDQYIKKVIRSILFLALINQRDSKRINEESFESEEFILFIETHFLLSIEVIKSTILIEDHFSNSAESISKILVNDSFKRGQLYDDYLKTKWATIQEKYDDKLNDLLTKKEQELFDLVNDSKDTLDTARIENKNFSERLEELFQEKNNQLNEVANTINNSLSKIKSENELQKKELYEYNAKNNHFYEDVNAKIDKLSEAISKFKEDTSKSISKQTEEFTKRDLNKKVKEKKQIRLDTAKKSQALKSKIKRLEKQKEILRLDSFAQSNFLKVCEIFILLLTIILACLALFDFPNAFEPGILLGIFMCILTGIFYYLEKTKFNQNKEDKISSIEQKIEELKDKRNEIKNEIEPQLKELNDDIKDYIKSIGAKVGNTYIGKIESENTQIGNNNRIFGANLD